MAQNGVAATPDTTRVARAMVASAVDAWRAAIVSIEALPDAEQAWELASDLSTTTVKQFQADAGQLRVRLARRIQDEQRLSLSQLGSRLGVSKGRAQEWITAARTLPAADGTATALGRETSDGHDGAT